MNSSEELYHKLGVIEAKIDMIVSLEDRVVSLESFKWKAYGAVIAISGLVSFFVSTLEVIKS